jgi:hypothetical protein
MHIRPVPQREEIAEMKRRRIHTMPVCTLGWGCINVILAVKFPIWKLKRLFIFVLYSQVFSKYFPSITISKYTIQINRPWCAKPSARQCANKITTREWSCMRVKRERPCWWFACTPGRGELKMINAQWEMFFTHARRYSVTGIRWNDT